MVYPWAFNQEMPKVQPQDAPPKPVPLKFGDRAFWHLWRCGQRAPVAPECGLRAGAAIALQHTARLDKAVTFGKLNKRIV